MIWWKTHTPLLRAFEKARPGRWRTPHKIRDAYWVIDLEFDQLDARKGRILSAAAFRIEGGVILLEKSFHAHVNQSDFNQHAIPIHGLRIIDLEEGISEGAMLEALLEGGMGAWWCGHQPSLDKALLEAAMLRYWGEKVRLPFLDTLDLVLRKDGLQHSPESVKAGEYALEALCKRYGVPHFDPHTSAGDAFATAGLLLRVLE